MIGRLMLLDVADTRAGKLAAIDGQIADVNLSAEQRRA